MAILDKYSTLSTLINNNDDLEKILSGLGVSIYVKYNETWENTFKKFPKLKKFLIHINDKLNYLSSEKINEFYGDNLVGTGITTSSLNINLIIHYFIQKGINMTEPIYICNDCLNKSSCNVKQILFKDSNSIEWYNCQKFKKVDKK